MISVFVFVFGAIVGSFLNVCIHRMPREQSVVTPPSHCPHCNKGVLWYDNIPLLSYLILGARCRFCKKPISLRYFLVEFLTAMSFLVLYMEFGLSLEFFSYAVLVSGLIASTFIDIDFRIIPDEISVGGIVVGLLFAIGKSVAEFSAHTPWLRLSVIDSLLGILVGGGVIYVTGLFGNLVFFKLMKKESIDGETESMGGGDVKLLAAIGAFLGWKMAILTFFVAPFLGSIAGIYILLRKGKHTIPYGPALALAAVICIFFGKDILYFLFGIVV